MHERRFSVLASNYECLQHWGDNAGFVAWGVANTIATYETEFQIKFAGDDAGKFADDVANK